MKYRNTIDELIEERDELINEATHYYKYRFWVYECIKMMKRRAYENLACFPEGYDFSTPEAVKNLGSALNESAPIMWEVEYIFRPTKLRNQIKEIKPIKQSINEIENLYDKSLDIKERVIRERANAANIISDEFSHLNNVIRLFYEIRFEANNDKTIASRCSKELIDYCFNSAPDIYGPVWELIEMDARRFVTDVVRYKLPEPNIAGIDEQ